MIQQLVYRGTAQGYRVVAISPGLAGKSLARTLMAKAQVPTGKLGLTAIYSRSTLGAGEGATLVRTAVDPNGTRGHVISHIYYIPPEDMPAYSTGIAPLDRFLGTYPEVRRTDPLPELTCAQWLGETGQRIHYDAIRMLFAGRPELLARFLALLSECGKSAEERALKGVGVIAAGGAQAVSDAAYQAMETLLRKIPGLWQSGMGYRSLWTRAGENVQFPVFFTTDECLISREQVTASACALIDVPANRVLYTRGELPEPTCAMKQLAEALLGESVEPIRAAWAALEAEVRAEKERLERERKAREEAERREAERRAREEAERRETERRAREEAERKACEEAERRAREEAERRAREEAERKAREEAERREAERRAREEAERLEAERKAREEAERRASEESERRRSEAAKARRGKQTLDGIPPAVDALFEVTEEYAPVAAPAVSRPPVEPGVPDARTGDAASARPGETKPPEDWTREVLVGAPEQQAEAFFHYLCKAIRDGSGTQAVRALTDTYIAACLKRENTLLVCLRHLTAYVEIVEAEVHRQHDQGDKARPRVLMTDSAVRFSEKALPELFDEETLRGDNREARLAARFWDGLLALDEVVRADAKVSYQFDALKADFLLWRVRYRVFYGLGSNRNYLRKCLLALKSLDGVWDASFQNWLRSTAKALEVPLRPTSRFDQNDPKRMRELGCFKCGTSALFLSVCGFNRRGRFVVDEAELEIVWNRLCRELGEKSARVYNDAIENYIVHAERLEKAGDL